jgi:hypothetical protein
MTAFVTFYHLLKRMIACNDPAIPAQSGLANR